MYIFSLSNFFFQKLKNMDGLLEKADIFSQNEESQHSNQIFLTFRNCLQFQAEGEIELNFCLWNKRENKIISEEFQVLLNSKGVPKEVLDDTNLKTIFQVSKYFFFYFFEKEKKFIIIQGCCFERY